MVLVNLVLLDKLVLRQMICTDEVTLVGGGINITTNASNDTITFTGGGAGISEEQVIAFAIVYG